MDTSKFKVRLLIKSIAFLLIFMPLHYLYDWFPGPVTAIFSGTSEGIFQHIKIGFWDYAILCVGEYVLFKKSIPDVGRFIHARLLSLVFILPWGISLIWYILPAILGAPLPNVGLEMLYAITTTLIVALVVIIIERDVESISFSRPVKIALPFLLLFLLVEMIAFTFQYPWADFFR